MKKNINFGAALFLCGLWVSSIDASQPSSLPVELSAVDTSQNATTTNTLMGSVQTSAVATSQGSQQNVIKKVNQSREDAKYSDFSQGAMQSKDTNVLYQPKLVDDEEVYLNFEDVDLVSVASYMENLHNVTFVTDDAVVSTATTTSSKTTTAGLQGHKVSFRMFKSVTKRQSWNLFITFLKMAGLDLVPMAQSGFYKIVSFANSLNEALPTYIGVDKDVLPENDMMIRYVYFLQNSDVAAVQPLITQLQGSVGKIETYTDLKALVFIDKAYNIRSLMNIVIELDRAVEPQVVSVIKLQRALADDVITLYNSLKPTETASDRAWAPVKKESSLQYFPSDVVLVSDKRTNSLIVLGTEDAVLRIENFIRNHVDEEINYRESPVYTYQLEYTNSSDIKAILSDVVSYGSGTTTSTYGGTLDGEKYFSPMTIVADTNSNSLIINATKSDYTLLEKLIKELDVPQKQIAFDFLVLQVTEADDRQFGSQIAGSTTAAGNAVASTFLNGVSAQTSGVPPVSSVVSNESSIKASLAGLITGVGASMVNTPGSTLITFGKTIWGLLKIVKTIGTTQIIANPFLVTTNNTEGKIVMGNTRRVKTSDVITAGSNSTNVTASGYEEAEAALTITVTPQVNDDNIINLSLTVNNSEFTVTNDPNSPTTNKKVITTTATLGAGEVLVLGGIVTETIAGSSTGVPILEKIPVLGWLFKSKTKEVTRDHFVVFIAPRILDPLGDGAMTGEYTQAKIEEAHEYLDLMSNLDLGSIRKDPISKAFFKSDQSTIHLLQEDAVAYQQDVDDKNALMNRVYDEELANKKKKRRRRKSKSSKSDKKSRRKRRRKKSKFKKDSSNPLEKERLELLVGNKLPELSEKEKEVTFIEGAFPLNSDKLATTSLYDAVSSDQGEQNA